MRITFILACAAVFGVVFTPSTASAYGAAHVGYTHAGPNGVYHTGATAVSGPRGDYYGGHTSAYGTGGGAYHSGSGAAVGYGGAAGYHYSTGYTDRGYGGGAAYGTARYGYIR